MRIDSKTTHPLPWSTDGVFIRDGKALIIGAMHTLYQAQLVVEAVNGTGALPAQLPLPLSEAPPPAPAPPSAPLDPMAVTRASLQVLAGRLALLVVPEVAGLVLEAMKDVPDRVLQREQRRDDWRGRVAGAELTRRLDEFARSRHQ